MHPRRFPGGAEATQQLGIYAAQSMKGKTWRQWPGWIKGLEGVALPVLEGYDMTRVVLAATGADAARVAATEGYKEFATKQRAKSPIMLSAAEDAATALKLPQRSLLGNYYTALYTEDAMGAWQLRSAVRRGVRLRREFFEAASAATKVQLGAGPARPRCACALIAVAVAPGWWPAVLRVRRDPRQAGRLAEGVDRRLLDRPAALGSDASRAGQQGLRPPPHQGAASTLDGVPACRA
jgi:hypothetical protein